MFPPFVEKEPRQTNTRSTSALGANMLFLIFYSETFRKSSVLLKISNFQRFSSNIYAVHPHGAATTYIARSALSGDQIIIAAFNILCLSAVVEATLARAFCFFLTPSVCTIGRVLQVDKIFAFFCHGADLLS
jgi:hypothetical protein